MSRPKHYDFPAYRVPMGILVFLFIMALILIIPFLPGS